MESDVGTYSKSLVTTRVIWFFLGVATTVILGVGILIILGVLFTSGASDIIQHGLQRQTMAAMREIATANGVMHVDTGRYAESLGELGTLDYMPEVLPVDGWGNSFIYVTSDTYSITSRGSDGQPGPPPPDRWPNVPYEPDIILTNGQFVQAPTGQ